MMATFQQIINTQQNENYFQFTFNSLESLAISLTRFDHIKWLFLITLFVTCINQNTYATNFAIEQKISDELIQTVPAEEVKWLSTGEAIKIFALFKPSALTETKGGLIILHDSNQNPDWPAIIQPVRDYFPQYGWATLSIQTPILPEIPDDVIIDEIYQHIEQRINAGIQFLNQENINRQIIVAQGMSANLALKFASLESNSKQVHSIVIISAYDSKLISSSDYLSEIPLNILDIIAEHDWPQVLKSGQKRLSIANLASNLRPPPQNVIKSSKLQALALNKTGNLRYRQEIISGANHSFDKQTEQLLKIIRGWINRFSES